MTQKAIEEAVIDWVSSQTGLTAILAYQNAPAPSRPYASVMFIGDRKIGTAHEVSKADTETDQVSTVIPRAEIHTSISVFAAPTVSDGATPTAFELLRKLRDSAELDSQKSALAVASLTVMDVGEVLNIPEVINNVGWQARAVMDVTFFVTHDFIVESVPWVRRVSGTTQGYPYDTGNVP